MRLLLPISAAFAFLWAVARAAIQSITIDEADTYLSFVAAAKPFHWYPAANNHVLNSALMRLSTALFGISHLSVRAPALLGALIYIAAALTISKLVAGSRIFQWCVFVCLVFNPFVFDYFVAARGYGLATAFLLAALAIAMDSFLKGISSLQQARARLGWASACLGLSISANFAFAPAAIVTAIFCFVLAAARLPLGEAVKHAAAAGLPGIFVTFFLCSYSAIGFPRSEFVFGAEALHQTIQSVVAASLYEPNPNLLNPLVLVAVQHAQPWIFPAIRWASIICAAAVLVQWKRGLAKPGNLGILTLGLTAVLFTTLTIHWVLFHFAGILLPLDRTAEFVAPLGTLVIAMLAALSLSSGRFPRLAGNMLGIFLFCLALSYLGSLRLTYFKEWKYDADVRDAYWIVSYYNQKYGVTHASSQWRYSSALNFYRAAYRPEGLALFEGFIKGCPPGQPLYVLYMPEDDECVRANHLVVVYRGGLSDMGVAVQPTLLSAASRVSRFDSPPASQNARTNRSEPKSSNQLSGVSRALTATMRSPSTGTIAFLMPVTLRFWTVSVPVLPPRVKSVTAP
jgi:hypothetical protein